MSVFDRQRALGLETLFVGDAQDPISSAVSSSGGRGLTKLLSCIGWRKRNEKERGAVGTELENGLCVDEETRIGRGVYTTCQY